MFISVDLPAPFSPTIAWMVPRSTRRWMSELATTPGKRLVIPRSSTAVPAAPPPEMPALAPVPAGSAICHSSVGRGSRRAAQGDGPEGTRASHANAIGGGLAGPPPSRTRRLLAGRHLDGAADDLLLVVV